MARRVIALASAVAWTSLAAAQTPAPVPGAAPAEMIILKTAGQPERRVQVLKTEKLPDGKVLTEVKDLATGVVFTLADTKPLTPNLPLATPATPAPTAPALTPPAMLPGTTIPSTGLPQAKPRATDPLLGGTAMPQPTTTAPAKEYPSLVGKLRQQQQQTTTQQPQPQSSVSKALFGSYDEPRQPMPTLAAKLSEKAPVAAKPTATTKAATFGGGTQQAEIPTLANKLFGDKPQPQPSVNPPKPPVASNIIRPTAVAMTPPPPRPAQEPVTTMAMTPPTVAPPAIQPAEALQPVRTDPKEPNFQVVPVKAMNMKQIEEIVKELRTASRPTNRLEAADALAACPMAGMVEVRQIIAEASYRDPVPVVRAHCIELLTKMGYDEQNYKQYVAGLINDEEPAVQRAARAATR